MLACTPSCSGAGSCGADQPHHRPRVGVLSMSRPGDVSTIHNRDEKGEAGRREKCGGWAVSLKLVW